MYVYALCIVLFLAQASTNVVEGGYFTHFDSYSIVSQLFNVVRQLLSLPLDQTVGVGTTDELLEAPDSALGVHDQLVSS